MGASLDGSPRIGSIRPAIWQYGESGPALCIHCADKLQHILNTQFLQSAAMMNQSLDDLDYIMPVAPSKGRVPVEALARAMQRATTLNISVTNSNVGVINTGDLAQIDASRCRQEAMRPL